MNDATPSPGVETPAARLRRYLQFAVIVLAAGTLYPLMYLRQNFEISVLEALGITASDLGELYSLLGFVFAVAYIPSGRLADRFQPRLLMAFSLLAVGALGFWFSTWPSLAELRLIFLGWGLAGGLCFWASLIKAVKLLALSNEQGRFFGILDGGRGLVDDRLESRSVLDREIGKHLGIKSTNGVNDQEPWAFGPETDW